MTCVVSKTCMVSWCFCIIATVTLISIFTTRITEIITDFRNQKKVVEKVESKNQNLVLTSKSNFSSEIDDLYEISFVNGRFDVDGSQFQNSNEDSRSPIKAPEGK